VARAGGTPREFTTITVTDGIAMGHQGMKSSLVSREVIADSTSSPCAATATTPWSASPAATSRCRADDGDGASQRAFGLHVWRLDPARPLQGQRDVTIQDVFEAVGQHAVGKMSDADLEDFSNRHACPSAGACGGQFTANTMACVSEAIGLALPGSAGTPAPYETRDRWAEASGEAVMASSPRTSARATSSPARPGERGGGDRGLGRLDQWRPAPAGDRARGRDRVRPPRRVRRSSAKTPYIADLKPAGQYVMRDLHDAGGVPLVMKALLDGGYLHGDCLTVTGKTIAENLAEVTFDRARRWCGRPRPDLDLGRRRRLKGNLAPQGAIVKVAGLKSLKFRAPRAASTPRRTRWRRCRRATVPGRAMSSSSATRARAAGPACARCWASPRRSTARAWATRWR
jgi:dihydroxy-acid dehydratase